MIHVCPVELAMCASALVIVRQAWVWLKAWRVR